MRLCHSDWLLTVLALWLTAQDTGDNITRRGARHVNTSVFDWCCFCYVEKWHWISASATGWSQSRACDQNDINSLSSWELRELYLSVFVMIVMGLFARQHLIPLVILGLNMSLWTWSEIVSFNYYLQSAPLQINRVSCFVNACSDFKVGFMFHIIQFSFIFMWLEIPSWNCNQEKWHKFRNRLSHGLKLHLLNKDAYYWAEMLIHEKIARIWVQQEVRPLLWQHCTYGAWCYYRRKK